jgi:hypothetical protein
MRDILAPPGQQQAPPEAPEGGQGPPAALPEAPPEEVTGARMGADNLVAGGLPPGIELPKPPTLFGGPGFPASKS